MPLQSVSTNDMGSGNDVKLQAQTNGINWQSHSAGLLVASFTRIGN